MEFVEYREGRCFDDFPFLGYLSLAARR